MADTALLMSVSELAEAVHGTILCDFSPHNGFFSVATDSRNVLPGSLFVPLMGEFRDGHTFINKALDQGAAVVFVDAAHEAGSASLFCTLGKQYAAAFIIVENTLRALQDAAGAYLDKFPRLMRVGITGSSGKTTTKEIVGSIFSQKYNVVMNEGNLNSETGLPLSVFKVRKEHEVGVFELGMNRRGEISEIARVLRPALALITNIGTAHIGILGSQQAIAEEKKEIFSFFESTSTGFVPEDDPWGDFLSDVRSGSVLRYGKTSTPGFTGARGLGIDGTLIRYEGRDVRFPLPGPYNLKNALGAIALARHAGVGADKIKAGIESVKPLFGRAEIVRGDVTLMLDCYNANPDSMESALEFCRDLEWAGRKIFVLGSMLELGEESPQAHRKVCALARDSNPDRVYLFGREMVESGAAVDWGSVPVEFHTDIDALSAALANARREGDFYFVKGSRGMALERACPAITGQGPSDNGGGH